MYKRRLENETTPQKKTKSENFVPVKQGAVTRMDIDDEVDPMAQGTTGTQGGTVVGGGLRDSTVGKEFGNSYQSTHTIKKRHTWLIKMHSEDYVPVRSGGAVQQIALDTRLYEVPDNEVGFYMDRADIDFCQDQGRYWKIQKACWKIDKADVITLNSRSDAAGTQTLLQTQWQPALRVYKPSRDLPPGRSRNWINTSGSTVITDNSYDFALLKCGLAHSGTPTYLPKITFQLLDRSNAGDNVDPLHYNNNNTVATGAEGNLEPFQSYTEYEMAHAGTLMFDKRCHKFTRAMYNMPYGIISRTGEKRQVQPFNNSLVQDYDSQLTRRNIEPFATEIAINGTPVTFPAVENAKPWWWQTIGPDQWETNKQWRNNADQYYPHMTDRFDNPPTFLAMNRLPEVVNGMFEVLLMLEMSSEIVVEFDTPVLFPYNLSPVGSFDTTWHGDNRIFYYQNDVTVNTSSANSQDVSRFMYAAGDLATLRAINTGGSTNSDENENVIKNNRIRK